MIFVFSPACTALCSDASWVVVLQLFFVSWSFQLVTLWQWMRDISNFINQHNVIGHPVTKFIFIILHFARRPGTEKNVFSLSILLFWLLRYIYPIVKYSNGIKSIQSVSRKCEIFMKIFQKLNLKFCYLLKLLMHETLNEI